MNHYNIEVAGAVIDIKTPFRFSNSTFKDFICDKSANIFIELDNNSIDIYNSVQGDNNETKGWEGNLQDSIIIRLVAKRLVQHNTLLIHGAAISCRNEAFIFVGASGTGKTTHILKWLRQSPHSFIINDDKPFLKISKDLLLPLVYGSPWAGKENLFTNSVVPLKSIILLERAEENIIEKISFEKAFPFLLQQVYRPEEEELMRQTLQLIQLLSSKITFWRFQCNNFKDNCFDIAYNALVND